MNSRTASSTSASSSSMSSERFWSTSDKLTSIAGPTSSNAARADFTAARRTSGSADFPLPRTVIMMRLLSRSPPWAQHWLTAWLTKSHSSLWSSGSCRGQLRPATSRVLTTAATSKSRVSLPESMLSADATIAVRAISPSRIMSHHHHVGRCSTASSSAPRFRFFPAFPACFATATAWSRPVFRHETRSPAAILSNAPQISCRSSPASTPSSRSSVRARAAGRLRPSPVPAPMTRVPTSSPPRAQFRSLARRGVSWSRVIRRAMAR
mmetsp:Transcript_59780/g.138195  ORF Transcript_59780/g.138195 Transcript_59780/m.138195 type:complete len:266 (+) Transcript_59780:270-1067(+)